jgi:SAM-dependent methyltransferase
VPNSIEENQLEYDQFIQRTQALLQDQYSGGQSVSENEKFYILNHGKSGILDLGCGTGNRTLRFYEKEQIPFLGVEKFPEVVRDSPYREKILVSDVADENLHQTVQDSNFSYELVTGFGGLINAFMDPVLRESAFRSLDNLMRNGKGKKLVLDTLKLNSFGQEKGEVVQLYLFLPP